MKPITWECLLFPVLDLMLDRAERTEQEILAHLLHEGPVVADLKSVRSATLFLRSLGYLEGTPFRIYRMPYYRISAVWHAYAVSPCEALLLTPLHNLSVQTSSCLRWASDESQSVTAHTVDDVIQRTRTTLDQQQKKILKQLRDLPVQSFRDTIIKLSAHDPFASGTPCVVRNISTVEDSVDLVVDVEHSHHHTAFIRAVNHRKKHTVGRADIERCARRAAEVGATHGFLYTTGKTSPESHTLHPWPRIRSFDGAGLATQLILFGVRVPS